VCTWCHVGFTYCNADRSYRIGAGKGSRLHYSLFCNAGGITGAAIDYRTGNKRWTECGAEKAVAVCDSSDDQESWLQTTVEGLGTLSFYWSVSSDGGDYLRFYLDGVGGIPQEGLSVPKRELRVSVSKPVGTVRGP
jgi:hypothetical protein